MRRALGRRIRRRPPVAAVPLLADGPAAETRDEREGLPRTDLETVPPVHDAVSLEVVHQEGARVGVLVPGRDDTASRPTGLVDAPAGLVPLPADLHVVLVLVPAADAPAVRIARELPREIAGVVVVAVDARDLTDAGGDLEDRDAAEAAVRPDTRVPRAGELRRPRRPPHEPVAVGRPLVLLVVAHHPEHGKIRPERLLHVPDPRFGRTAAVAVVPGEHQKIRPFAGDELQHRAGVLAGPLIADERDGHARRAGSLLGHALRVNDPAEEGRDAHGETERARAGGSSGRWRAGVDRVGDDHDAPLLGRKASAECRRRFLGFAEDRATACRRTAPLSPSRLVHRLDRNSDAVACESHPRSDAPHCLVATGRLVGQPP